MSPLRPHAKSLSQIWEQGLGDEGSSGVFQTDRLPSELLSKADDECYARVALLDLSIKSSVIDSICLDELGRSHRCLKLFAIP